VTFTVFGIWRQMFKAGQGAINRVLRYRKYGSITIWYFFLSATYHVGTRNSCYLRTYILLVLYYLSKPEIFKTLIQ
jgi:hypothetical protein